MNCFVTVVTGANKGIGLACCKALARGYGWHALGFSKAVVVMASRDLSKLQMAKEEVTQNALSQIEVDIVEMNVSDDQSVLHAAKQIENKRKRVDLLINNAGICVLDSTGTLGLAFSEQAARTTMDINLRGVIRVCQAISPLMTNPRTSAFVPHVVNLSSMGAIKALQTVRSPVLLSRIKALDSLDAILNLSEEYCVTCGKGKEALPAAGWSSYIYGMSKVLVNAVTKVLAAQNRNLRINCLHPGTILTDIIPPSWYNNPNFKWADTDSGSNAVLGVAFGSIGQSGFFFSEIGTVIEWDK